MAATKFQVKRELIMSLRVIEQLEYRINDMKVYVQKALDCLDDLETTE